MNRFSGGALQHSDDDRELEVGTEEEEIALTGARTDSDDDGGRSKRRALLTAGGATLAVCAIVALMTMQDRSPTAPSTAPVHLRSLLESGEFHDAATDALANVASGLPRGSLRDGVAKFARHYTARPEVGRHLESRPVDLQRQQAILHAVRQSTSPEVQSFGRRLLGNVVASPNHAAAAERIREAADFTSVRKLQDTLFPSRNVEGVDQGTSLGVDPERMHLIRNLDDSALARVRMESSRLLQSNDTGAPATTPASEMPTPFPTFAPASTAAPMPTQFPTFAPATSDAPVVYPVATGVTTAAPTLAPAAGAATTVTTTAAAAQDCSGVNCVIASWSTDNQHKLEEALEILADLVLEADNILSNLDQVSGTFDKDGRVDRGIPYWSKSMMGGASALLGVSKCFLEADDDAAGADTGTFSQSNFMLCSMQYAESVVDFLGAVDDIMGGGLGSTVGSDAVPLQSPATTTTYWAWSKYRR